MPCALKENAGSQRGSSAAWSNSTRPKQGKSEDERRDLADICILIGEVNQYIGAFRESIKWFWRAAAAYGGYAIPFHNLATSFMELGDLENAIASLEREIALEPGNYFSRLRLADLYERQGAYRKVEECLESLLSRNPDNIQALHKLITHYESQKPAVNVRLLRRRLLSVTRKFSEMEMVIVVYHLCREEDFDRALRFHRHQARPEPRHDHAPPSQGARVRPICTSSS